MPSRSRAQNRFFHWSQEHPGAEGAAPPKVSKEFLAADHGKSLKGLPQHVPHKAQGGPVRTTGYPKKFNW
jgi:hypothetical protein